MKLVPIEPTDEMIKNTENGYCVDAEYLKESYRAMTAECPTVEVVDVESLRKDSLLVGEDVHIDQLHQIIGWNSLVSFLANSGYKIIKETK